MKALARFGIACAALGLAACSGNDFPAVSAIQGVRVLAVRPEAPLDGESQVPATGLPGETLTLDMLYMDGRVPITAPGQPQPDTGLNLMWLGGCHNPPSRLYYGCGPVLTAIAEGIAQGPPASIPPGIFGTESPFSVPLPEDILASAPRLESDPIHFGISYVFFGVCAGEIHPRPDRAEGIPLDCVDGADKPLGAKDFVVGFTTLYTYEGVKNLNPELLGVRFDGNLVTGPDCAEPGSCVPTVPACTQGEECPEHRIEPVLTDASFELGPDGAHEIMWTSFYAAGGAIVKESQLASDRTTGRVADFTSSWRAPGAPGIARLWVTVNDERGGAHWASFDVIVE
jgi:hypothetical protein